MIFKQLFLSAVMAGLLLFFPSAHADEHAVAATTSVSDVKADVSKPYIIKKGDTLWDIANRFFRNPYEWLKIWELNLSITNPDLIYPGNKIWFDGSRRGQGGLTMIRPHPEIIIRPVQRIGGKIDSQLLLTVLQRQGSIQPNQLHGVGYIVDSQDERLNYGVHDMIYLKLNQPAKVGTLFDVFRSVDTLHDPHSGKPLGVLIEQMGQIKVGAAENGVYRGVVIKAFEEISRGDRLKPARTIDLHLVPSRLAHSLSGTVIYMRNNEYEAAQNQVIGINLGLKNGLKPGMQMSIYKAGRLVKDKVAGGNILLPQERIGEVLVLATQQQACIALITKSTAPVNIGDTIKNTP